jgi:1-acyl-sn-glycerol-3-phosphate acyltransferase
MGRVIRGPMSDLVAEFELAQRPKPEGWRRLVEAIDAGGSLIVFPEGTWNMTSDPLLPFKSGIYHLARTRPSVDLVPTWIDNLNRVMPKGEFVPLPLICTVTFGALLRLGADESKQDFLMRTQAALLALSPMAGAR